MGHEGNVDTRTRFLHLRASSPSANLSPAPSLTSKLCSFASLSPLLLPYLLNSAFLLFLSLPTLVSRLFVLSSPFLNFLLLPSPSRPFLHLQTLTSSYQFPFLTSLLLHSPSAPTFPYLQALLPSPLSFSHLHSLLSTPHSFAPLRAPSLTFRLPCLTLSLPSPIASLSFRFSFLLSLQNFIIFPICLFSYLHATFFHLPSLSLQHMSFDLVLGNTLSPPGSLQIECWVYTFHLWRRYCTWKGMAKMILPLPYRGRLKTINYDSLER